MENRFGIKDFFLFTLVAGLIVLVVLAMFQYDRQYDRVVDNLRETRLLAEDLNDVRKQIGRVEGTVDDLGAQVAAGVRVAGNADGASANAAAAPGPLPGGLEQGVGRGGAEGSFYLVEQAEEQPEFARGGWFLDDFGTKIGRLTPFVSSDVYQTWLEYQVLETLAVRDPHTLEFLPRLARGWTISDDGLEMTFKLRKNATFSDGEPVTADDVVFTYDWVRNPDVQADRTRSYLTELDTVEKVDDYTVRFTFKNPYYLNFEYAAGVPILAEHYYSKFSPTQFNEAVGLLFGSGPYVLQGGSGNWSPGGGVTLVRNPRYWGEEPTFDRIVFGETDSEDVAAIKFRNQEVDVLRATPEIYDQLVNDSAVMAFAQDQKHYSPYRGYTYVGWNQRRTDEATGQSRQTPFADARVRKAMTMLLDRERLAEEIYLGYATPASGPFAPQSPQANPSIDPWPHDVAAARSLLEEAGYADRDGDGVIEGESGDPLAFTLTYPGGSPIYEKIVLFMRDNFKRGGIKMETERADWPVLVRKLNAKDFDAITLGWSGTLESDPYQIFHSSQIEGAGDNRISYRNPDLDAAIEEARRTVDTDERMQSWHRVHQILHEDQPYTFLLNRPNLYLFNERIHNIEKSEVGLNFEYLNGGMIPWFIPAGRQTHSR